MLKVTDIKKESKYELVIDYYVPITFENFDSFSSTPMHYRVGNFEDSLIEIGLHPGTGCISTVVVTMFNRRIVKKIYETFYNFPFEPGIPQCDISMFNHEDRMQNEKIDFLVCIYEGDLWFLFSEKFELNAFKVIKNGRIGFGLDKENLLIAIVVFDLTENEKEEMELSIT